MPTRAQWLWLFVGSLAVTAVLGMMALLIAAFPFDEELLFSSSLISAYSLAGLMASIAIARSGLVVCAWAGAGLLLLSMLGWLSLVWFDAAIGYEFETAVVQTSATCTLAGILGLHASLLSLAPLERRLSRTIRWVAIGTACATVFLLVGLVWDLWDLFHNDEWIARVSGALALPAGLGTIAVPVLARIEFVSRREGQESSIGRFVPVRFRCPRCDQESEQAANRRFLCPGCGLEARITIAEPRCVCGYLLQGRPEPVCPECGRGVEQDLWWRPGAQG